jgi:methylmalonyl-CoA/ethylmalonyl-CoA epimerase
MKKIDHVGIAVRSLEDAIKIYGMAFGLDVVRIEEVPEQRTRVAMLPVGGSRLELLEATDRDSPVARSIAARGEGVHHLCFQVHNLEDALARLREAGLRLVDGYPRKGAGGCLVAFVHPSSASGVLIELSQPLDEGSSAE